MRAKVKFEIYQSPRTGGLWYWRVRYRNGRIGADCGFGYTRKYDAKRAIYRLVAVVSQLPLLIYTYG